MPELLADHNIPRKLVRLLRQAGYRVLTAQSRQLAEADDLYVLTVAAAQGWAVITLDKDFAGHHRALLRRGWHHAGLLWLTAAPNEALAHAVQELLARVANLADCAWRWTPQDGWQLIDPA